MADERSQNQSEVVEEESNEGNQTEGQRKDETQNEDKSEDRNEHEGDIPGQERNQDDVENRDQSDNLGQGDEGGGGNLAVQSAAGDGEPGVCDDAAARWGAAGAGRGAVCVGGLAHGAADEDPGAVD